MSKIGIILQREYLTRVRNKTFLLSTFLFPITIMLILFGSVFFAVNARDSQRLAVVGDPGFYSRYLVSDSNRLVFSFEAGVDSLNFVDKGYDGILYLPDQQNGQNYQLRSSRQFGLATIELIERSLDKALQNRMLEERGIDQAFIDSLAAAGRSGLARLDTRVYEDGGNTKESNAGMAYGIGFGSGILIYITMFIFGSMVMRGVMEEKTNRIAEVIVSSCKPFELMLGKIIGIAGVGLTQLLLWIGLILVLMTAVEYVLPAEVVEMARNNSSAMPAPAGQEMAFRILEAREKIVSGVNWWLILPCFLFYFLGGYLFYASLFAAVGSVINEDPQEAQSLMLPITMPIIFGFIILSSSLENPNSPMAVWASLIPFTSPIVMMGRIPFGVPSTVPVWQLALSMALMVAGFLFTTWFAGKVYRTGILLYGKKASWKEMARWAFRKG
ncbi:MAG: ABC transporter permease [Bacteroidetes bacterium]|nr:ABC transporter permease [Bacteroidota bacterium]